MAKFNYLLTSNYKSNCLRLASVDISKKIDLNVYRPQKASSFFCLPAVILIALYKLQVIHKFQHQNLIFLEVWYNIDVFKLRSHTFNEIKSKFN